MRAPTIIKRVAELTGLREEDVKSVFCQYLFLATVELRKKKDIELPYMGRFFIKTMKPAKREVANFHTGERKTIHCPAKLKLKYKSSGNFNKLLFK